jgi:hypothetical protein
MESKKFLIDCWSKNFLAGSSRFRIPRLLYSTNVETEQSRREYGRIYIMRAFIVS